jgi:hypothetical protein
MQSHCSSSSKPSPAASITTTQQKQLFTATGAIDPRTRKKWVNFSLRETFFNGAFILHANRKSLEYRNNLPLPMTGVGSVVLAAEWRLGQALHKPRLMVALGTDAGAAVVRPGTVSWRKAAFPFNRHLGLEVRVCVFFKGGRRVALFLHHGLPLFNIFPIPLRVRPTFRPPPPRPPHTHTKTKAAADASVAMQHDFADDRAVQGGFRLNLDVRELNLVLRV